jgi:hypothetical protein
MPTTTAAAVDIVSSINTITETNDGREGIYKQIQEMMPLQGGLSRLGLSAGMAVWEHPAS